MVRRSSSRPKVRVNGVAIRVGRTKIEGLASLGQEPLDAVLPGAAEVIPLGFIPEPSDFEERCPEVVGLEAAVPHRAEGESVPGAAK